MIKILKNRSLVSEELIDLNGSKLSEAFKELNFKLPKHFAKVMDEKVKEYEAFELLSDFGNVAKWGDIAYIGLSRVKEYFTFVDVFPFGTDYEKVDKETGIQYEILKEFDSHIPKIDLDTNNINTKFLFSGDRSFVIAHPQLRSDIPITFFMLDNTVHGFNYKNFGKLPGNLNHKKIEKSVLNSDIMFFMELLI